MSKFNTAFLKIAQLCIYSFAILVATVGSSKAQAPEFSGFVYSDYYYVASSHVDELEGQSGYWFRRIYLTMDQAVNDNWSMQLRAELSQPGDFKSKSKMVPFAKDAYLKWKGENQDVYFGLSSSPTWALAESQWGYRSVEKSALDLYKYGSSRDVGVAVKGKFGSDNKGTYHIMLANGSGTSSEVNKGKKAMASLQFTPSNGLTIEAYADFERSSKTTDKYMVRGAFFYSAEATRFGAEVTRRTIQTNDLDDESFEVLSVYGVRKINDKATVFGRFDRQFQLNPSAELISYFPFASADDTNFIIAGLDFTVADNVHFIPNLEVGLYSSDEGDEPDSDVMARITIYYKF